MNKKTRIIPVFVPHKGCPHDCVFCNQKRITGKNDDDINREYVIRTVEEYLKTQSKYSDIAYFGGSFTAIDIDLQKELLEVAFFYKNKGIVDNIRISTRPDAINEEILDLQKKYGVTIIELGVQSLNDDVLIKSNRGHSVQDVINASKLIKEYGFILGHQVMPGLPGSTRESDIHTCKMSIEMKPDIARIYPTLIIKDTELECMYKNGTFKPLTVQEAVEISSYIYSLYTINGVNVIRVGLQNTESINTDHDVISGPFHPAFRQLVDDAIYLKTMDKIIKKYDIKESMTVCAQKKIFSNIVGQNKSNIKYISDKFNIKKINLKENSVDNILFIDSNGKTVCEIDKETIIKDYVNNL